MNATRYRWIVLVVGCLAAMLTGALRQGLPALAPAFRDAFDLSLGRVGITLAALAIGMTAALVPWGAFADRTGERLALAAGLLGTATGLAAAGLASSYWILVAALFATGLCGASATSASGRAVLGWFAFRDRGLALGIRQMAIPVGGALAALALPAIALAAGFSAALLALAGAAVLVASACALWVREPPRGAAESRWEGTGIRPMRDRRIWRLGIGSGLMVMGSSALTDFGVLFLHEARGLPLTTAGGFLAAMLMGSALGRVALGYRSDRIGRRIAPLRQVGLVGSVLVALMALLVGAPGWMLYPTILLGGIAMCSWNGLSFTAAAEMGGFGRAGTAIGLQSTLLTGMAAITAPLFGALVDATSWRAAWLTIALAPFLSWHLLRPLQADEAHPPAGLADASNAIDVSFVG